jgi:Chagasin family peptidase inhibitor I42
MIQFGGRQVAGFGIGSTTELGIQDSGRRVTMDVGDTLLVKLPGKDSPGSGWVLTPGDPNIIDVVSTSIEGDATAFALVAKGAGTTHLEFSYRHPFEHRSPIKTVVVDVTVNRSWLSLPKIGLMLAAAAAVAGIAHVATRKKRVP